MDYETWMRATLDTIHAAMRREAVLREAGDTEGAALAYVEAAQVLRGVLDEAHEEGREEAAEEVRDGRDLAEDYEPDVSDVGFDPYLNTYTDDC